MDLVYPPVCGICGKPADSEDRLVCMKCWGLVEDFEFPFCSGCREMLPDKLKCLRCRSSSIPVFSIGHYSGPLQKILHDLKFSSLKPLARPLGLRLAGMIEEYSNLPDIDLILPVPLHESLQNRRGFNQSEEIARAVSAELGIPIETGILCNTRRTRQQARLPAQEREANVRGAYGVDDPEGLIRGKTVLLVDDIVTTGATLKENRRILKQSGAGRIIGATVAAVL